MPRYKLTIEYDGTGLVGWQRQAKGQSVQALLERAVTLYCGKEITVHGAGRTDAGVHALAMTAHLDLPRADSPDKIRGALNHHMRPARVAVLSAELVDESFDARRSAKSRHYRYRILNRRGPPMLERDRVWHVAPPLDDEAMAEGAQFLLGKHDFSTFRDSLCQAKTPVKTLDRLDIERDGDEIRVTAKARSFLHHQVRNMVGTLKLVGLHQWRPSRIAEALAARDRRAGGPMAPAHGLYLVEVTYEPKILSA
ncbi:MAG TPA: tRNA pseudouridine(38-40) synthase TruA [Stellaceae bacterium]|jgi:tRNA pseudouridine38-40 synthase